MSRLHLIAKDLTARDLPAAPDFDAFTDRVMGSLLDQEDASGGLLIDPDITASITARTMTVEMSVVAGSVGEAEQAYHRYLRAALEVAGADGCWATIRTGNGNQPTASPGLASTGG